MYDNHQGALVPHRIGQGQAQFLRACITAIVCIATSCVIARADDLQSASVVRKIMGTSDKLELTTNSSRILTLDKNIPRVQVNNPELLAVTPLSATQVQISAKKAGVTQVNLWDDEGKIHTVDVLIYGDARELEVALQTQFPHASIKVFRYSESLVLNGYVDRPDHVSPIMQLAADYSPKVINNIQVGGVQQVLLKVKVMEMSRTKLRRLATDIAWLNSNGSFFSTGVSGLLNQTSNATGGFQSVVDSAGKAAEFGIVTDHAAFFGFLDWLQENHIAKTLSEPNIMAVSGRPAQFNVGGEIPIVVPQSLGTASIEYKPFGTQIDFLPIVLGNGKIRLEVRPRISAIDPSHSVIIQNFTVPALTVRQVDTAVEMQAGQTFALAGLVEERTETQKRGLPYVQDMPIVGVPFRKTEDVVNEIELLVMVTPEFVDAMDPCEVPCGGPGTYTTSPDNRGLYCGGHMEVPTACNPTQGLGACGQSPCDRCGCSNCGVCNTYNGSAPAMNAMPMQATAPPTVMPQSIPAPAIEAPEESSTRVDVAPAPPAPTIISDKDEKPAPSANKVPPAPQDIMLPAETDDAKPQPKSDQPNPSPSKSAEQPTASAAPIPSAPMPTPQPSEQRPAEKPAPTLPPNPATKPGASYYPALPPTATGWMPANTSTMRPTYTPSSTYTATRPYAPAREPVFLRNASSPNNPQPTQLEPQSHRRENNLIGPVGYDTQQ